MSRITLNISQRFGRLFTVRLKHDYYSDKRCLEMRIAPTLDTQMLLDRLGLQFRNRDGECFLGYQDSELLKLMLGELKDPLKFSFVFYTKAHYFANYTDLPFKQEEEAFHYSNWEKGSAPDNVKKAKNPLKKGQLLPIFPEIFNYKIDTEKETVAILIKDEKGDSILEENHKLTGSKLVLLNISTTPSGKYTLYADGKELVEFYHAKTQHERPFGFLDIHAFPQEESMFLYQNDELTAQTFDIYYKARSTRWKFLVPDIADNTYTDFTVEDEQNEVQFLAAEAYESKDGRRYNAIHSEALLQFSQTPHGPLYIKYRKKNGKALPIKRAIPAPGFERIVPERDNDTYCSEVIIYI